LIDTHSHIYGERFGDDVDEVVARAIESGVERIIIPATKPSEFDEVLEIAGRHPSVSAAIGVHPHHAAEVGDEDLERVARLAGSGEVIAIGEIGLDYYYDFAPRERQHEIFREQLRIARRHSLPAIIHNRESDEDLLGIIDEEQDGSLRVQLHCFSSSQEILERAVALGAMISFTGNVTFAKSTLADVVRATPADRLMIETDAPYMTPVPFRGKRNEPSYLGMIAAKIAEIRGETLDSIKQMTTDNARRFFGLLSLLLAIMVMTPESGSAQPPPRTPGTPRPTRAVDTTTRPPFEKLVGIGGHIASSTYIAGATTLASALGYGGWLSIAPLQPIGVDWLQIDLVYTAVTVAGVTDSALADIADKLDDSATIKNPPPNFHNTFDISFRFTANPREVVTFFGSVGLTYFYNEFGADEYILNSGLPTTIEAYIEETWGIGGSFGVSFNYDLPFGTVSPTAEWRVMAIDVFGERKLKHRPQEFLVSQPRIGLIVYPNFNRLF
jgi:TatD DNase family protein